ncbi:MAG TPA: hypothetical protein VD908_17805 [Cytophagales bacterium]|nr:hypothetical protein [Cytophagales bacterium]
MSVGPRVAFVDDIEAQITQLDMVVRDLKAGSIFFNANPEFAVFPESPIETVKLLFLDLYYKKDFDPEMPAQWVESIIPKDTQYDLVIWSRDTDQVDSLLDILDKLKLKPNHIELWQKNHFTGQEELLRKKVSEITRRIPSYEQITQDDFFGEIVSVEDDGVLINCKISSSDPVFQTRKFDRELVSNLSELKTGVFVKISIYSKPGARLIDVVEEKQDRSDLFQVQDYFEGLENTAFFTGD